MPVLSSAAKQIQYEHVMTQLLQRDLQSSPIAMALEAHFGVGNSTHKDVDNIVTMTEDDIASLEYEIKETDPNDDTKVIIPTPASPANP